MSGLRGGLAGLGVGWRGLAVQYCDKVLWDCLTNAAVPLGVLAVTDEALVVTDA